ncbi:MAG TPA: PAS domain-containing sensor histidine kinase, partial [Hyphomicrobiaceae bacterium]|nr:PAS domain-containing sensor histidine kinase [Hyphomicrobiaceae bacterium]
MANADALGAPGGSIFARRRQRQGAGPRGNARVIAEPAYRRLLAAEPWLRRSIPALIVIFLVVVAAVRFLTLLNWREDIERNAKAMLALSAGELINAVMLTPTGTVTDEATGHHILDRTVEHGSFGSRFVLAITDGSFKVVSISPNGVAWRGKHLDELITSGQPLFMFGDRAGVME